MCLLLLAVSVRALACPPSFFFSRIRTANPYTGKLLWIEGWWGLHLDHSIHHFPLFFCHSLTSVYTILLLLNMSFVLVLINLSSLVLLLYVDPSSYQMPCGNLGCLSLLSSKEFTIITFSFGSQNTKCSEQSVSSIYYLISDFTVEWRQ